MHVGRLLSCSLLQGQIFIGGAAVLEAAVEAKNGRLYIVDGVLTPPSIVPVLPHRCDLTETKVLKVSILLSVSIAPTAERDALRLA